MNRRTNEAVKKINARTQSKSGRFCHSIDVPFSAADSSLHWDGDSKGDRLMLTHNNAYTAAISLTGTVVYWFFPHALDSSSTSCLRKQNFDLRCPLGSYDLRPAMLSRDDGLQVMVTRKSFNRVFRSTSRRQGV
jgi:hypothetical protein